MEVLLIFTFLSGIAMIVFIYRCGRAPAHRSGSDELLAELHRKDDVSLALPDPSDMSHPDNCLIWTTQIPALRFVSDREPRGVYCSPLTLIYLELSRRYPEIYDGRTFRGWVEFYVRMGVFRFEDDAIHITRAGNELLDYLVNAAEHQALEG